MARILKLSPRRRNILLILFTLFLINLFVFYEYLVPHRLTLEEESIQNYFLDLSDHSPAVPLENPPRILLVSSLFILSKSKHSKEEYHNWLQRFLGPVTTDVYFYTSFDLAPTVKAVRGDGLPLTVDTNYTTPFDTPPLKGLEEVYNKMHAIDRENSYHSPELYSVWSAKPFFLDNAVRVLASQGKTYDYVFWNDGGSFRETNVYKHWPDPTRLHEVWEKGSELSGTKAEDLLFYPIQHPPYSAKHWKEDMGPIDTDFSEGSFFGGSPKTVAWWARTFYAYHDYYISKIYFVGKDQTLFNSLLVLFNERVITVWVYDPEAPAANIGRGFQPLNFIYRNFLGSCGPEWYYYQFWLSDRKTRDEMRQIWLKNDREPQNARWWKVKLQCRITGVLALNPLLKRTFGESWKAPVPTLDTPPRSWQQ